MLECVTAGLIVLCYDWFDACMGWFWDGLFLFVVYFDLLDAVCLVFLVLCLKLVGLFGFGAWFGVLLWFGW